MRWSILVIEVTEKRREYLKGQQPIQVGTLFSMIAACASVGQIILPTSAVRDEGVSYHYVPASREVSASGTALVALEDVLKNARLPYRKGKTWTTAAPYHETPSKIERRKAEGCITVEMEASAFFAVAHMRGVTFAQVLYGGDDVRSDEWNECSWRAQTCLRGKLFWLAAEASCRI